MTWRDRKIRFFTYRMAQLERAQAANGDNPLMRDWYPQHIAWLKAQLAQVTAAPDRSGGAS